MILRRPSISVLFCAACSALCAQTAATSAVPARSPQAVASFGFAGGMPTGVPSIAGAPFSGVRESEHTQTLADGTHISQKYAMQKIYRDRDGRVRVERPLRMEPNITTDVPVIVLISDPVAGYNYTLDTENKIAHRAAVSSPPSLPPPPPSPAAQRQGQISSVLPPGAKTTTPFFDPGPARPSIGGGGMVGAFPSGQQQGERPQFQHESLGSKIIDGISVQGTRTTITIPEGSQGNDRPIVIVSESWTSPELKETIESTSSDPRSGDNITRLTQIDRANPDPSLFQVPSNYQITDEQGPFNMFFNRVQPQHP